MSDEKKHYPGYLKGKKVRVEKSNGGIVNGTLKEFTTADFIVVELSTGQDQLVNTKHIVSIEEGVN